MEDDEPEEEPPTQISHYYTTSAKRCGDGTIEIPVLVAQSRGNFTTTLRLRPTNADYSFWLYVLRNFPDQTAPFLDTEDFLRHRIAFDKFCSVIDQSQIDRDAILSRLPAKPTLPWRRQIRIRGIFESLQSLLTFVFLMSAMLLMYVGHSVLEKIPVFQKLFSKESSPPSDEVEEERYDLSATDVSRYVPLAWGEERSALGWILLVLIVIWCVWLWWFR